MRAALLILALLAAGCDPIPRPTADPGPLERTAKAGEKITLDGSASKGRIDAFEWDFGDGESGTGAIIDHAWKNDGNYSASLTVRGPGGVHSASVAINVGAGCNAVAMFSVTTPNPQPGQSVHLVSTGSRGCDNAALAVYAWEFGDGTTEVNDGGKTSADHTWADAGTYDTALTVTDVNGRSGRSTRSLGIGVAAGKPTVQCVAALSTVAGRVTSLSATASDPGGMVISSWEWDFGDGSAKGSGSSTQHTWATAGMFTTTVTATTADARVSNPCTTTVTVTAPPSYSGSWLFNPSSTSLGGCPYTVGWPIATAQVQHGLTAPDGGAVDAGSVDAGMTVTPSGGSWPAGSALTGNEDPPPAAPGTFRVRKALADETKLGCGNSKREDSVTLGFTSNTSVTGTWNIIYTATSCLGSGPGCVPATCNCVASVGFSGVKQ